MQFNQAQYQQQLNLDERKYKDLAKYVQVANLNDTAFEIIKATSKGERELYYPEPWFIPMLYHIYPSLFEFDFKSITKK